MNHLLFPDVKQTMMIGGDGHEPPEGSREWFLLSRDRLRSAMNELRSNHGYARKLLDKMAASGAWVLVNHPKTKRPFQSFNVFCKVHFQSSVEELDQEITDAQQMAGPEAEGGVAPLAQHGEIGGGHSDGRGDIVTSGRGNAAAYLVAKLKRDAPEIAERLAAGEFKSARAAGIAAGIVTPDAPLTLLRRAWKRASLDERETFRMEIVSHG